MSPVGLPPNSLMPATGQAAPAPPPMAAQQVQQDVAASDPNA